ncbi:hypothetical protein XH96_33975 [Bradyrhizobium sp. CCBAU 51765]|nr:hypothetical protein [Bradyrhizobium sp. CCBAU 21360]QOZ11891.1 hypothetical protein XH96_33975 [Bradyrhizobium sp. CCBAU 51765]
MSTLPLRFAATDAKCSHQVQNIRVRAYPFMLGMSMGLAQASLREQSFTRQRLLARHQSS